MKKILAIAMAVVMVMALAVTASAETIYEYTSPVKVAFGWTTLIQNGDANATDFFNAIGTEGAVIEMIGTDLVDGDRQAEVMDAWFQICTQDTVNWTEAGGLKTEGIGETYGFTDEGYVITVPAAAFNEMVVNSGVDAANLSIILNAGGSWAKTASKIVLRVSVPDEAAEAPAEAEEAPAEAEEAAAEAEAPAEAPAAEAEAPAAEAPAETAKAPSTGIALAVIPAVMALAAAAVSKKH